MGELIELPIKQPSCFDCLWHAGTFCHLYSEVVDSEIFAALGCEGYEVDQ